MNLFKTAFIEQVVVDKSICSILLLRAPLIFSQMHCKPSRAVYSTHGSTEFLLGSHKVLQRRVQRPYPTLYLPLFCDVDSKVQRRILPCMYLYLYVMQTAKYSALNVHYIQCV